MGIARQLDGQPGDGGGVIAPDLNQEFFVSLEKFFRHCAANGLCTFIASFFGTAGTGFNYHDEANPATENAFFMTEWAAGTGQAFYVYVHWTDAASALGVLNRGSAANDGVYISMAVRDDGTNPWNGTSNDDGADTKGSPLWTDGGSTVRVFPRSNATGGAHVVNKNNCATIGDYVGFTPITARMNFVANENTILLMGDLAENGIYDVHCALGRYAPRTGAVAAVCTTPYFMLANSTASGWFDFLDHGTIAGTSAREGGIVCLPVNDVMIVDHSTPSAGQTSSINQPNNLVDPPEFEPTPMSLFAAESGKTAGPGGSGDFGLAGYVDIDIVAAIFGSSNHQTNAAGDIAYIGTTTLALRKHAISWDGGALPGTVTARTGRQSFTP